MAVGGNGSRHARRSPARNGRSSAKATDYREFVFTATGRDTDLEAFGPIDLYDNLALELERLETLAKLLVASGERSDADALGGVGLLLQDVHARMREILRASRHAEGGE